MSHGLKSFGRLWRYDRGMLLSYVFVVAFLGLFVVAPLLRVALAPTVDDWRQVLTTPRWRGAAVNTLTMMLLSTVSSLAVGALFAYAVTKARVAGSRAFSLVPILLLITPPFVSGLAFILLLGRRGLLTYQLLGLETSIYGWHGLWFAQTQSFFPIAFLVLHAVFQAIDPSLEQAARSLGAGRWQVLRSVTLPMASPGFLAAGLFIAIGVLGDFGNPMLVGGRFRVLATEVYTQLTGWANIGTSAALGLVLLVPAMVLFAVQQRVQTLTRGRFATVGGRGSRLPEPPFPAAARWPLFAFCLLVTLFVVASHGVVLLGAVTELWGIDFSLTLAHLGYLLGKFDGLGNSLRFAGLAALLCTVLSGLAAYLTQRTDLPARRELDLATLLPAAIPGTLMGVAFVLMFNSGPLKLTGGGFIIVVAMAASYLPVGYRICVAALAQLQPSLDESAANLGASRLRALLGVIAPLLRPSLVAAFVFCFIQAIGTLSTVIFLVSFDTPLASVSILNLAEQGRWGRAAALASALVAITFASLGTLYLMLGRSLKLFGTEVARAGT